MNHSTSGRIYYLIPDIHRSNYSVRALLRAVKHGKAADHVRQHWFRQPKPVGGIKVMLQHCMLLQEMGYEAWPLRIGRYEGNFFGYPIQSKTLQEVGRDLQHNDVVLCPEITPYLGLGFGHARAVMFAQNWTHMYGKLRPEDQHKGYIELGYQRILVCSQFLRDKLQRDPTQCVALVNNFIDHECFKPDAARRIPGRVMALPRKNPNDLRAIMREAHNQGLDFHLVDGVPESRIIEEYQKADIFLATGYPEGFGLPPLEAMACGAAVVGFTGGGADEFMRDGETALTADDGDTATAARKLVLLAQNPTLKETLRQRGTETASVYVKSRTQRQLAEFFGGFDGLRRGGDS